MTKTRMCKLVTTFFLMNAIGLSAAHAAAGFKIGLESASDLGVEFAGGAAIADDASANYYNAAGITRAKGPQFSISAVGVLSDTKFEGTAFSNFIPNPGNPQNPFPPIQQIGKAKTTSNGIIPALHFTTPIRHSERFFFGVSAVVPYGLGINYPDASILRYANTHAKAQSILISPSLAYKVNNHLSFGAGPDFEYFNVDIENAIAVFPVPGLVPDAFSKVKARSWEMGWHVGGLLQFNEERTRIGASYRSEIKHDMHGTSRFYGVAPILPNPQTQFPGFPGVPNLKAHSKVKLDIPANALVSVFHAFNPTWAVMASAQYTFWDTFDKVKLSNIAAPPPPQSMVPNITRTSEQDFHNTWHFAVGTQIQATDRFMLRLGLGMEDTPTSNRARSVIIPNADNIATTIGFRYDVTDTVSVDFGYSHAFIDKVKINHTEAGVGSSEVGRSLTHGNAAGLQLNWKLA